MYVCIEVRANLFQIFSTCLTIFTSCYNVYLETNYQRLPVLWFEIGFSSSNIQLHTSILFKDSSMSELKQQNWSIHFGTEEYIFEDVPLFGHPLKVDDNFPGYLLETSDGEWFLYFNIKHCNLCFDHLSRPGSKSDSIPFPGGVLLCSWYSCEMVMYFQQMPTKRGIVADFCSHQLYTLPHRFTWKCPRHDPVQVLDEIFHLHFIRVIGCRLVVPIPPYIEFRSTREYYFSF